jgi:hypothetical protein
VDQQIRRVRELAEAKETAELDRLGTDLFERPSVAVPGEEQGATILYRPN